MAGEMEVLSVHRRGESRLCWDLHHKGYSNLVSSLNRAATRVSTIAQADVIYHLKVCSI